MRIVVAASLAILLIGCSSEQSAGTGGAPTTTSSGTAGSGGQGGSAVGGGTVGGGSVGGSGVAGTGGAATGGGGGATLQCPANAVICDGNTAKICDGNGGFSSEQPCGGQVCVPNLGCVDCEPGTGSCNGDIGTTCGDDGMTTIVSHCDSVQGMSCNPSSGRCDGVCSLEALGLSYVGCDYYPTVTANVVSTSFNFAVVVANTTPNVANVTVTQGASTITTDVVAADDIAIIHLPWQSQLKGGSSSQVVTDGAYRLRSDQPVAVYEYNPLEYQIGGNYAYTNDASLLLPVNVWSGNYRLVAYNGSGGLYAVIASQDGTSVTVTPSATGGTVSAGGGIAADGTGTVSLDAGDVLQVMSGSAGGTPDQADLTGTLITADKPVQVIGGHRCTFVPHSACCCDHLEEVIPPLETVGKEYIVTAPLIQSNTVKARILRVIATADSTTVSYDPPQAGAPTALTNAGDYFEIAPSTEDFRISADEKIVVAQFMQGQFAGGNTGDPAMTIAVTTAQYRNDYLFHAPTNYEANYLNVVAPTGATVTLDAAAVAGFTAIGSTGFSVARVPLSNAGNGNHSISSSLPFGITVYGYGQYTSFWYPGGLDLTPLGL